MRRKVFSIWSVLLILVVLIVVLLLSCSVPKRIETNCDVDIDVNFNGHDWIGPVRYTVFGPIPTAPTVINGTSAPATHSGLDSGNWTCVYVSGGPPGASFLGIRPADTQTVSEGGTITFTLDFVTSGDVVTEDPLDDLYGDGGIPATGPDWQDITDLEVTVSDETIDFILTVNDEFPDMETFQDGAIMILVDIDEDAQVVPSEGPIDFYGGNFDYGIFIPSPEFGEPPIFIEDLRLQGGGGYDTAGAQYNIEGDKIEIMIEPYHIGDPEVIRFVGAIRTGIMSGPIEDRVPNEGLVELTGVTTL